MNHTLRVAIVLALLAATSASTKAPSSSSGGGGATTYTAPAEPAPAAVLPGAYVEGLGQPLVSVRNNWGAPLFVNVTDAAGATLSYTLEAGAVWEMRLAAGTFSYNVTDGTQSVDGTYYVEADTAYEWTFAAEAP